MMEMGRIDVARLDATPPELSRSYLFRKDFRPPPVRLPVARVVAMVAIRSCMVELFE
jgi:hypothetical protein